jgi:hypothetical protein
MRIMVLISTIITASAVSRCAAQDPSVLLESFANRDLLQLSKDEKGLLSNGLDQLLPAEYRTSFQTGPQHTLVGGYEDCNLWRLEQKNGSNGFILLQVRHPHSVPGSARLAVHVIDKSGKILRSTECSTGWRTDVKAAVFKRDVELGGSIIEIETSSVPNTEFRARQFYGLINNRLALLRVESANRTLIPNNYSAPRFTAGPDVKKQDGVAWEAALNSNNKMEVLEALQLLGSVHPLSSDPDLSDAPNDEPWFRSWKERSRELADLLVDLRRRNSVRNTAKKLSESDNTWIRQAAQKALEKLER